MAQNFLPEEDRDYLEAKCLQYLEIVDNGQNGLVFESYKLPEGKYNISTSSLLIILPQGYPDVPPDMFFCYPILSLASENVTLQAVEGRVVFNGETWQQWSRHFPKEQWRSGIDGIHTYLQIVNHALKTG